MTDFPNLLLFIMAVIFLFSVLYSVIETIRTAEPERRQRRLLELGGLAVSYITITLMDVKGAMTVLTESTIDTVLWPIIRTAVFTFLFTRITMIQSKRQDRIAGRKPTGGQIIGGILLACLLVVLIGLSAAYTASSTTSALWLQEKSDNATRLAAVAFFILFGAAAYMSVYLLFTHLKLKWLTLVMLCVYTVLALALPPAAVKDAGGQIAYAWGDGIRPFILGLIFGVGIFQIIRNHQQAVRVGVLKAPQEKL